MIAVFKVFLLVIAILILGYASAKLLKKFLVMHTLYLVRGGVDEIGECRKCKFAKRYSDCYDVYLTQVTVCCTALFNTEDGEKLYPFCKNMENCDVLEPKSLKEKIKWRLSLDKFLEGSVLRTGSKREEINEV
jgi:hypothetical protein